MSGHDHNHGSAAAALSGGAKYERQLLFAFVLIGVFFVVELIGGLLTNSLALLSDAGHMFTDVLGLGMAWAAVHAASTVDRDATRTYGLYRVEILAALANAVLLFGVALFILVEAWERFHDPPAVLGLPMLVVATFGLGVNLVVFFMLRDGASESLNVEGAYLEVMADTLGSVGAIAAAIIVETTGYYRIDVILGVVIGLFVLPRTYRLGSKAVRILVEAAPPDIDTEAAVAALRAIDGVASVHDLHVWTITAGMESGTVHITLTEDGDARTVLNEARRILRDEYGVEHTTVQVEPPGYGEQKTDIAEADW